MFKKRIRTIIKEKNSKLKGLNIKRKKFNKRKTKFKNKKCNNNFIIFDVIVVLY